MASLWDQLTKLLPNVLPSDPDEAINGSELLKRVSRKLDGDYAENTLRAHFSRMAAEPDSVIAKVEDGHGYYLRREVEPPAVKAQLERLLPQVLPKDPAKAVNGTKLIELLAPKLEGDFKEDSLRWYFSRMAADETSVIAKVADGHGYFLRRAPDQTADSLVAQLTAILPKLLSSDPEEAVNGTRLIELVRPKLDGDYAENTLRAHFSRMSADASSVLAKVDDGHGYFLRKRGGARASESLWDQLSRVLPKILSPRPAQALTGTELIEKLGRVLDGDYAENTLRAHFSRMSADLDSVIAKVDEGNGYFLRKPQPPASLQDQLVELLPSVLPRNEADAINGTELMKLVLPKVRGEFAENTLRAYFSQMAAEPESVIAKVDGGHGYFLRPVGRARAVQRSTEPSVRKAIAAPVPAPVHLPPPLPHSGLVRVPRQGRPGMAALPEGLVSRLGEDEKAVLSILRENGSARTTELASRLSRNPLRLNGLMRALRRVLHDEGVSLFTDEVLPDGETMYRYTHKESH